MKFQTGLSFGFGYIKKSFKDGHKIFLCNSLAKFFLFFPELILETNMMEKRSIENQSLLTSTLNTLLPAVSSATSMTYKLIGSGTIAPS